MATHNNIDMDKGYGGKTRLYSKVWCVLIVASIGMLSGCASLYVASVRREYNREGFVSGVFAGEREYPRVYPATALAVYVEVPTWWYPAKRKVARQYQKYLWPLGATLSLADVAISMATDTVMLPYDSYKTLRKE